MNNVVRALSAGAALLMAASLAACGGDDGSASAKPTVSPASAGVSATPTNAAAGDAVPAPEKLELRYQGSANSVNLPELAADLGYLNPIKLKWVGNTISGPQDIQSAATDQTDFGGAFSGAVAKLIEAGAPVKGVIDYYGTDEQTFTGFYVKDSSSIHAARDLIGKKVGVNALGANYEAVIDTYLSKAGLSNSEIKQVQLVVIPPVTAEQSLRNGQIDVATLGGVLQDHAVAAGGLRKLFSDLDIFGPYNGGQYVLRTDFIKKNPVTAKLFVTAVAKAIEWERTTPRDQVIAEFTKIIGARGRNESTDTLKYWKSVGVASKGGVVSDADFTRWTDWLVSTGALKNSNLDPSKFYTNEFNPYAKAG
ncbi:MAG: transporter substrate-binding protein [Acidimicrobiia bacterium]|nr:transporter substrate-binding protein [Acidimicrobiia bacterium]